MPVRVHYRAVAAVAGLALSLSACAASPAAPVVAEVSSGPFIVLKPPHPARARRIAQDCRGVRAELAAERKEALFRQFTAEQDGEAQTDAGKAGAGKPGAAASDKGAMPQRAADAGPNCRQADR